MTFKPPVNANRPLSDEDLIDRASIDGRVAFAMAAFVAGASLVALLDRVGVPERIVAVLGPALALCGLALIGLLLNAVRVSRFYAAGRAVPAPYAGLALVALTAGFALPFAPPGNAAPPGDLALGLGVGLCIAALVTGPLLRKTGAFSLPDLIAARFPFLSLRLGVVAVVAGLSLAVAAAGFELSVRVFEAALGSSRPLAAALSGFVLLFIVLPGGMSGVVWGATGAAGMLLAGLALPLMVMMASGETLPAPVLGDGAAWADASKLIQLWHGAEKGAVASSGGGWLIVIAVALGMGAMAPLLGPSATTRDAAAARQAGVSSLVWGVIVAAVIGVTIAASALLADQWMTGERPDRLPGFAYRAAASDLMSICGFAAASADSALAVCEKATGFRGLVLRPQDFAPSGLWLTLSLPELRELGVAFAGLTGAALLAIGLVLSGAGFCALGAALGHDALYRVRESHALTSRRLAMTRVIMAIAIVALGGLLARQGLDPRKLIGIALVLSASAIAPLLALSLWPRANGLDASVTLLAGLCIAGGVIAASGHAPDPFALALAAVAGACGGFVLGVAASFAHPHAAASEGSMFVRNVLHGETDILHRDKGA